MSCTWPGGREAEREGNRKGDGGGALNEEQLERLARYFDEEVMSSRNYKPPYLGRIRLHAQLPDDTRNVRWEPGRDPLYMGSQSECRASVITRRSLAQRAYGEAGYGF
jgi:hypothetical protein